LIEGNQSRTDGNGSIPKNRVLQNALRILCGFIFILIFCTAIWATIKVGVSRLFSFYGEGTGREQPLSLAVQITPGDPEVHNTRALVLQDAGNLNEAIKEFERAAALRPRDFILWQRLGLARDRADDEQGAITALTESVRLAPFYARPRWQLGNVLFRAGRYVDAFAQMRRAVLSDPTLLPNFIDLTWGAYQGNTEAMEQVIRPETDEWRLGLARFYAQRGKYTEATKIARTLHDLSKRERQELVSLLIKGKQFQSAYEIWAGGETQGRVAQMPLLLNGGFEDRVSLEEQTFGWQIVKNISAIVVSQDASLKHSGNYSLRVEWNGESPANAQALSQIILTEPNKHYVIRFASRTEKIVSGGFPVISVFDANTDESRPLAQTKPLPQNSEGWNDYSVEFTTGAATSAVRVSLRREDCTTSPCPAFGKVWVDDFEIQKVN